MKHRTNHRPVVYGGYSNAKKITARLRAFDDYRRLADNAGATNQGP